MIMSDISSLSTGLERNLAYLTPLLKDQADMSRKDIYIKKHDRACTILYLQNSLNSEALQKLVDSLTSIDYLTEFKYPFKEILFSKIGLLKQTELFSYEEILEAIFNGMSVLLVDGMNIAFSLNTIMPKMRAFAEPTTERVVRGPKLSFIENTDENIGLIRQFMNNQNLMIEQGEVGLHGKVKITKLYIKGTADEKLLQRVEEKLSKVQERDIEDSGMLGELLEEVPFSPFQQIQNTERMDIALAALKDGRVIIMVDGSPFVLVVPTTINMLLKSPDDYYERWIAGTFLRILRYVSLFITLFLSSIYISLVSFNQGLLPTELALTIAQTRENVPFPPFIEAIIMEMTIELLREAGIRLPTPLGQTIGLVGGVVIGQAAVQANLVSSIMVIIVSITAITSFIVPQYGFGLAFRVLRFGAMISAALLGIYGVTIFFIIVTIHMAKLDSFTIPYFDPGASIQKGKWKDFIMRLPFPKM